MNRSTEERIAVIAAIILLSACVVGLCWAWGRLQAMRRAPEVIQGKKTCIIPKTIGF